ncbi:MAG TPA: hypothetical protein VEA35_00530 [Ramlibacter sp.]|nr:hypothetical protein [Ramlibacter sp.]
MASKSAASDGKFGKRFAEAIRQRTFPNTVLQPKQLAHVAGYSVDTFMRWCRGESRVPADALANLAVFFAERGDWAFTAEMLGVDLMARAIKLDDELNDLKARIAGLEQGVGDAATIDRARGDDARLAAARSGAADRQGRVVARGAAQADALTNEAPR